MDLLPVAPHEGHHVAAARLAQAIREASLSLGGTGAADDALPDASLDAVAGAVRARDIYWASADFLHDWRQEVGES